MSLSPERLLTPHSQNLLKQLCPDGGDGKNRLVYNTWKYMLLCFDTPRPSAKEEKIRDKLVSIANTLQCEYEIDDVGNLIIRKEASEGYDNRVRVAIQSHLDMVTSKTVDSNHDFETDGIAARITDDGEWVIGNDTTLGADDGIGVAAGLAILEEAFLDPDFNHGPLECLFTTEEETTMRGALEIAQQSTKYPGHSFLRAQALLNVDSEEPQRICVGCAGGGEVDIRVNTDQTMRASVIVNSTSSQYVLATIKVGGLIGGHTGIDINAGRGNAIQFSGHILQSITKKFPNIHLVSMAGGSAPNVIPRDAQMEVLIDRSLVDDVASYITQSIAPGLIQSVIHAEAGLDRFKATDDEINDAITNSTISITLTPVSLQSDTTISYVTTSAQSIIIDLLNSIIHGVIAMSKDIPDAVETSNAFSIVSFPRDADVYLFHCFFRSFIDAKLHTVMEMLQDIIAPHAPHVTMSEMLDSFPGWAPNLNTALHPAILRSYETTFNSKDVVVYSVHAGLETGPIMNRYPSLAAVSIGPLIIDAHSPTEKMKIDTVAPFIQWVLHTVEQLSLIKADDFSVQ